MNRRKIAGFSLIMTAWFCVPLLAFGDKDAKTGSEPETIVEVLDKAGSFEKKDDLIAATETFWELQQMNDFAKQYDMYLASYQDAVSLVDFLKKKRGRVESYRLHRMRFWGDTCAQVEYRLSMSAEAMQLDNVPMRQIWKLVDGSWQVYENPYKMSMMPRSFIKNKIEDPCPLPEEWQAKKRKEAAKAARENG